MIESRIISAIFNDFKFFFCFGPWVTTSWGCNTEPVLMGAVVLGLQYWGCITGAVGLGGSTERCSSGAVASGLCYWSCSNGAVVLGPVALGPQYRGCIAGDAVLWQ